MTNWISILIGLTVLVGIFIWGMREGWFLQLSQFFAETKEEMMKCNWPTWEELTGSTVVVTVAVVLLGLFTVGVDLAIASIIKSII